MVLGQEKLTTNTYERLQNFSWFSNQSMPLRPPTLMMLSPVLCHSEGTQTAETISRPCSLLSMFKEWDGMGLDDSVGKDLQKSDSLTV